MIFAQGEQGSPALEGTIFITLYKPHGDRQTERQERLHRGHEASSEGRGPRHPRSLYNPTRKGGKESPGSDGKT